jgi:hypothetical protein
LVAVVAIVMGLNLLEVRRWQGGVIRFVSYVG